MRDIVDVPSVPNEMAASSPEENNRDDLDDVLPDEELQEKAHFMRIINAFKSYRPYSLRRVAEAEKHYDTLSDSHKRLIPNFCDNLVSIKNCIEQNCEIIQLIIQDAAHIFENKSPSEIFTDGMLTTNEDDFFPEKDEQLTKTIMPLVSDMDKVKTTLKQFVRDWSDAGQHERDACYSPVIAEIEQRFPPNKCNAEDVKVLVPGAGLGRLAFELAKRGYSCQGNEWSLFMLFTSNFVLNKCKEINSFTLYPWVHQWTNNMKNTDQTRPITFPDTNPSDLPENANFSMAAGDFLEVYQEKESWDCLATVFFIDTAHNIIAYIESIYNILKPGGYWVNLGPLLYHYSDMPNEMSIELSYEEVKSVIEQVGFIFEKEEKNIQSTYTQNPASMLHYSYNSVFFVVRKPA